MSVIAHSSHLLGPSWVDDHTLGLDILFLSPAGFTPLSLDVSFQRSLFKAEIQMTW